MQVQIKLKKILAEKKLDEHGICLRISQQAGIHRHTVAKLYNNEKVNSISFEVLEKLCAWLHRNADIPRKELPHILFDIQPSKLINAIAASGQVTFYMGEHRQTRPYMRWIALHDAMVHTEIIWELSTFSKDDGNSPIIQTKYVPFSLAADTEINDNELQKDIKTTRIIYNNYLSRKAKNQKGTAIILGSMKVNYVVEYFIAEIFGCEPFKIPQKQKWLPFYMKYRESDRAVPSCFGGRTPPPDYKETAVSGIYYRDKDNKWIACPWEKRKKDSGIVIIDYEKGTGILKMALFGFSGLGTYSLGNLLFMGKYFWPLNYNYEGREIAVYICRFNYESENNEQSEEETIKIGKFEVIEISKEILEEYL